MDKKKLRLWQERLVKNETAFEAQYCGMDERERIYRGTRKVRAVNPDDDTRDTPHVRNIAAEIIEAQVDSNIPKPKVTPKRKEDEWRAKLIEDMLLCELDRLNFESINDMASRTVPIQGGAVMHVEWDNTKRTHTTVGEISVNDMHPKQFVPQDGVFKGVQDMDYLILKLPQTKGYIKRKYGVDVTDEFEEEPEIKGVNEASADDMVTQYIAYYKNDNGGIGMYSWVCDVELCDLPDYQARQTKRCKKCGAVITGAEVHIPPTVDGSYPLKDEDSEDISHRMNPSTGRAGPPPFNKGGIVESDGEAVTSKRESVSERFDKIKNCPFCESKSFEMIQNDFEELTGDIVRSDGFIIPALTSEVQTEYDELGLPYEVSVSVPTRIPFYKPDLFPVVLIKNVSVHGQLLGDSDIDKVTDAQNTTNRMWRKVLDKITSGGSYITLPPDATIKRGPDEMMCIYLDNPADKALIGVHDMEGNVSQDLNAIMQVYEESRQAIGITDSFQGRVDRTATSGKAKEFAAVQSAGRLESKRVMKEAAYAELYELMFKFKLAYADEPRPVMSKDVHGNAVYSEFNRYDFLEVDVAGEYFWNDDFLFSCDSSEPLSRNREAMWQETRLNFQSGTFGDPAALKTRILFWTKMEQLHYPGASDTKAFLEEELAEEQRQMQLQQQMMISNPGSLQAQAQAQMQAQAEAQMKAEEQERASSTVHARSPFPMRGEGLVEDVVARAKADAMRDAKASHQGVAGNI